MARRPQRVQRRWRDAHNESSDGGATQRHRCDFSRCTGAKRNAPIAGAGADIQHRIVELKGAHRALQKPRRKTPCALGNAKRCPVVCPLRVRDTPCLTSAGTARDCGLMQCKRCLAALSTLLVEYRDKPAHQHYAAFWPDRLFWQSRHLLRLCAACVICSRLRVPVPVDLTRCAHRSGPRAHRDCRKL